MHFFKETLVSRKNPRVMLFASLKEKKGREENRLFMAEGEKLFFEAVSSGLSIPYLLISEEQCDRIFPVIEGMREAPALQDTEVITLSASCFEKISTEKAPQGIITILKHLDFFEKCTIIYKNTLDSMQGKRLLVLSSMQDPGNLGAVIRSALAFGAEGIILGPGSADPYHPRALRAAMGSIFRVRLFSVEDLPGTVQALQESGRRVFAAELRRDSRSLSEMTLLPSDVFVIGNEGHGIPEEVSSVSDASVYIPISQASESLNASVAAAVLMWEQAKLWPTYKTTV